MDERRRRVLFDIPSETDQFTGGGHDRTAQALANTLEDLSLRTCTVGVEGQWGSGKSTVVELAKCRLLSRGEFHFFKYDLWINQSAVFRRTFVESLLDWMEEVDASLAPFCSDKRALLAGRVVQTQTVSHRTFSGLGLIAILSLPLLPIVYSGLTLNSLQSATPKPELIFFSMSVVATLAISAALHVRREFLKIDKGTATFKQRLVRSLSSAIRLFDKDAATVEVEQSVREVDRTQHGFEKLLAEVAREFQQSNRRLIVVLDNVDRLPADRLPPTWSEIRSVAREGASLRACSGRFPVVVPYDRKHVLTAFSGTAASEDSEQEDFLRKTFDATFFVAAPILSDASVFFATRLREGIGRAISEEICDRAHRVFVTFSPPDSRTPRRIIAFINDVSMIYEQWHGEIPLPTITLFVAIRTSNKIGEALTGSNKVIDESVQDLVDDASLLRNLAAMSYNVPVKYSMQILLEQPIINIFTAGSDGTTDLDALRHVPGFYYELERVFRYKITPAPMGHENFVAAAQALSSLPGEVRHVQTAASLLIKASSSLTGLKPGNMRALKDATQLFVLCSEEQAVELVRSLAKSILGAVNSVADDSALGRAWLHPMESLLGALRSAFGDAAAQRTLQDLRLPAGAGSLVTIASEVRDPSLESELTTMTPFPARPLLFKALKDVAFHDPGKLIAACHVLRPTLDPDNAFELMEAAVDYVRRTRLRDDPSKFREGLSAVNWLFEHTEFQSRASELRRSLIASGVMLPDWSTVEPKSVALPKITGEILWMVVDSLDDESIPKVGSYVVGRDISTLRMRLLKLLNGDNVQDEVLQRLVTLTMRGARLTALREAVTLKPHLLATGLTRKIIAACEAQELLSADPSEPHYRGSAEQTSETITD